MKTLVVFNQKGGVGKTSTVANLMAELTARGQKVLAIDVDAQCNLTAFCGLKYESYSVLDWLLNDKISVERIICKTKYADVIPSDERLQVEMLKFASMPAFVIHIKNLIAKLKGYDFVLIDCPPTVNQLTAAALVSADYVLVPTELEYFSATGIEKIADTVNQVKPLNPQLIVLGILIVKYNANRKLSKALEEKFATATNTLLGCSLLKTKIRFTVDVPSSQAMGKSVQDYKANSNAAIDYNNLVEELWETIK